MSDGYIKLNRSILEWEWVDDPNTLRLWIQLLCTVRWSRSRYRGIELEPGQRIASLSTLAKELPGMTVRGIRTAKAHLIDTGSVTVTDTPQGDLITVVNWAKFQGSETESDTETDTESDKEVTKDRHTEKESKESKKDISNLARTHAHASARASSKEEKEKPFDVDDGIEIMPGIWQPNVQPVTPEEKRALALKCREVYRASKGGQGNA